MGMSLGDSIRVTLFGESHGLSVGALVEGIPAGTEIDIDALLIDIERRRPGRKGLSTRSESDECEILSGVYEGKATGWPILLLTRNSDARSRDYSFLPDHPRPGHADLPEQIRSGGSADLRGGGSQSARLTYGLVTASSQVRGVINSLGWRVDAHLHSVGDIVAAPIFSLDRDAVLPEESDMSRLNCRDEIASSLFANLINEVRMDEDSIGSSVECIIEGLPLGLGEPWFDGLEPALARGMMAIPGARAVEFSKGTESSRMRGSQHNDVWQKEGQIVTLEGSAEGSADGALGGRSTGAPLRIVVHFKPPSSISREQNTLHLPSGEKQPLKVKGRHDPVLGPRAVPVVEAVARLIVADLGMMGGFIPDSIHS
ncbi:MAG: chorismate synthase [Candidatus Thalassarchaeaceae archaeon]|nr:chorismate synthase [Candidatus Thalassarchaeaceae archaeon]DAC33890.1 MAG TPA: chorismate synthase [Candidatus Poseidoniales archaeon]HIH80502.1 chorismate synthase [Candidatus Thalassarchaeaceae archaeon]